MENKRSHLGMIHDIVNRMSVNSFLLKGWSVVLVSALFGLAASDSQALFIYLAYFPAIAFWILDGYFLQHQRRLPTRRPALDLVAHHFAHVYALQET